VDLYSIVQAESDEEHDPSLKHPVPSVMVRELQALIFASGPFAKKDFSWILPAEVRTQSQFECAAKEHRSTSILPLPAIKIAMPIAPRTGEILADLGVAVGHQAS